MISLAGDHISHLKWGRFLVSYPNSNSFILRSPEWCSRPYSTMWADFSERDTRDKSCHEVFIIRTRKERIISHVLRFVNTGLSDGFIEFSSSGLSCSPPQLPAIWLNTTRQPQWQIRISCFEWWSTQIFTWDVLTSCVCGEESSKRAVSVLYFY